MSGALIMLQQMADLQRTVTSNSICPKWPWLPIKLTTLTSNAKPLLPFAIQPSPLGCVTRHYQESLCPLREHPPPPGMHQETSFGAGVIAHGRSSLQKRPAAPVGGASEPKQLNKRLGGGRGGTKEEEEEEEEEEYFYMC